MGGFHRCSALLHAGAGFNLCTSSGFGLGSICGEGGYGKGQGNKGGGCNDYELFHGDSPFGCGVMFSGLGNYFTQVPDLIWVLVPVWLLVAAKAVTLSDNATSAAVAVIMSFLVFIGTSSFRVCLSDMFHGVCQTKKLT